MATRSASIAQGVAVDLTDALALEDGCGYLIELGPDAHAGDAGVIALGDDPESVGGHVVVAGRGRFIRQGSRTWFARFHGDPKFPRSTQLSATEADDCA